jgi:uncharacterized protein with GYD domain
MPFYVSLINFTDQGARDIRGTVERSRQIRSLIESRGGKVHGVYWTMGPYDIVAVVEQPDDETGLAGLFQIAAGGNVRTQTMRAFTDNEVGSALGKMG